ncbi:hypothetical protein [Niallia sp. Krafla_26]|uniref:hypothetical protein n=1 Tax=Niallia sp. Krafla_26 TaxID=3064703 RepID=UPI003D182DB6
MVTNLSWKNTHPKTLRKIVYALNETTLNQLIEDHEDRGWSQASEIKEHGYGIACLMEFKRKV